MPAPSWRRLGLCLALALALAPAWFSFGDSPPIKSQVYIGKVVPLAGLLEKFGSRLDAEAAPHWLALVTNDGKTYPLIKDDGSRLFFADPHLQNRTMRISGR